MKYVPPSIRETAFNCPHCRALAVQTWHEVEVREVPKGAAGLEDIRSSFVDVQSRAPSLVSAFGDIPTASVAEAKISICFNCNALTFWVLGNIVWPVVGGAPPANRDMPEDARRDYDEADTILDLSPRGAAALLRLAIQKLCKDLGQKGKNIDDDIKALVAAGLNPMVQKALDTVRVIGNEAVHPGQIDLRDDRSTAESLFRLVNMIVEKTISEPKQVDALYALLPEGKRQAIDKRDGK